MLPEHGVCIDCGAHTPLRLPRRFPHICTACLFPVDDLSGEGHLEELRRAGKHLIPAHSMMDDLLARNLAIGAIRPGERRLDG